MTDQTPSKVNVYWFRRDLRMEDNVGLSKALSSGLPILPIFIFDPEIIDDLPKTDSRLCFIHQHLEKINTGLEAVNSALRVYHGNVLSIFELLASEFDIDTIFCNHDYEPYARERDAKVKAWLGARGMHMLTFKDQVIFEKYDVLKDDGNPYTVFTPYMKKWKSLFNPNMLNESRSDGDTPGFLPMDNKKIISLDSMGFHGVPQITPEPNLPSSDLLQNYHRDRDFPSLNGTSKLSVHLRFGTVSIRRLVKLALNNSEKWLNEMIWREFYMMILWHFPYVVERCFKPQYDLIPWRKDESDFTRWCNGQTGYPLVDAGMRELNNTGYMHNRVRMVTASFLTKHLLINWQWGEAYFAEKLLDFELSSNNGGWQWAAGCGCDAAPYFRVFNPKLQAEKFDPKSKYIRKYIPEIDTTEYPDPVIDHKFARDRAIKTYQQVLQKQ